MIPMIDKIETMNDLSIFHTTDGVKGCGVLLELVDIECENAELKAERLSLWFRTLSSKVRARFILNVSGSESELSGFPRSNAVNELGYSSKNLTLVIEEADGASPIMRLVSKRSAENSFVLLNEALRSLKDLGFLFKHLGPVETQNLFVDDFSQWTSTVGSIETGSNSVGVVRLFKPSASGISLSTLANVISQLPAPFEVRLGVEKLGAAQTELLLQRRLKQFSSETSRVGEAKAESAQDTLIQTSISGEALLNYELVVVCCRPTKELLRDDLRKIAASLKSLGDVYIETIGAAPSFVASSPGRRMHVPLIEKESVLPVFAPIFTTGEAKLFKGESERAVSLHRRDRTLFHLDLLSSQHQNANAIVVGSSGLGKSVFLGTLTHSLLQSDSVRMIKVDVGGSHSRECELNGGIEYKISIDQTSGLNPFGLVARGDGGNEFVRSVLGQFLESLLKEEGEIRLSKAIRSQIDEALSSYLRDFTGERNLDTFYDFATELPRRDLLSRWCKKGLYANAFRGSASNQESRLRYFNFAEVFQAADPEFAQAAMAAVLATFNLEMRLNPDKRLVLVCDETPFFIERCFEFFKFSAANVRKFGASLILVVQLSRHLVVHDDTGVVENCSHKFLFSSDGPKTEFCSRLQISNSDFELLSSLSFSSGSYSELFYKYGDEARTLRLTLTSEEYWRLTSSQADRLKFDALMKFVPGLKVEEAIRCLSVR